MIDIARVLAYPLILGKSRLLGNLCLPKLWFSSVRTMFVDVVPSQAAITLTCLTPLVLISFVSLFISSTLSNEQILLSLPFIQFVHPCHRM